MLVKKNLLGLFILLTIQVANVEARDPRFLSKKSNDFNTQKSFAPVSYIEDLEESENFDNDLEPQKGRGDPCTFERGTEMVRGGGYGNVTIIGRQALVQAYRGGQRIDVWACIAGGVGYGFQGAIGSRCDQEGTSCP